MLKGFKLMITSLMLNVLFGTSAIRKRLMSDELLTHRFMSQRQRWIIKVKDLFDGPILKLQGYIPLSPPERHPYEPERDRGGCR